MQTSPTSDTPPEFADRPQLNTVLSAVLLAAALVSECGGSPASPTSPGGTDRRRGPRVAKLIVVRPVDGQVDGRRIPAYESGWLSYRVAGEGQRTPLEFAEPLYDWRLVSDAGGVAHG